VFVVACPAASGLDPAEILFEFDGVRRDSPPSREAGQGAAAGPAGGAAGAGVDIRNGTITGDVAMTVQAGQAGHSPDTAGTPHLLQPPDISFYVTGNDFSVSDKPLVRAAASRGNTGPFVCRQTAISGDCAGTLDANYHKGPGSAHFGERECVATEVGCVRRLTPTECERLQGFPDAYTLIPWKGKPAEQCPDGPRYKALGNSMAVPCMRWLGERINRALLARRNDQA
jgi:DNA (cytosine-5)-methyltransferase 1